MDTTVYVVQRIISLHYTTLPFADECPSAHVTALGDDVQSLKERIRHQGSNPPSSCMEHTRYARYESSISTQLGSR